MGAVYGVGAPGAISGASGGKVYPINTLDDTTPVEVAPENTSRFRITFHNPGSVDVLVFPQYTQATGTNIANTATVASRGGAILVFANGGQYEITGECQGAWYALAASGTGNPLTVIDTNVA